jgi:hypothetical protein
MQELPILDGVQEKLEIAKIRMIRNSDFKISWHMFKAPNWIIMLHALDKFNILNIKKELDAAAPLKAFALQQHKDLFNLPKEYITHNKVIESIR